MVAINITPGQDKDLPEWRRKGGYTFPVAVAEKDFARTHYGVNAAPTNLLLNADRKMVFQHVGFGEGGEKRMEAEVRELLGLDPFERVATTEPPTLAAANPAARPQAAVPAKPSASARQTEAENKRREIMTGGGRTAAEMIPALDQFIRDYPDYPQLNMVYSDLLLFAQMGPAPQTDRAIAIADEALTRFPNDVNLRRGATVAKIRALKVQKRNDTAKALAQKVFETETEPLVLQDVAWAVDPADGPRFFEKAIAERGKNPGGSPSLGELNLSYAQMLIRAGRKDEGIRLSREAFVQTTREFADLEALPAADPKRARLRSLPRDVAMRYESMANRSADAGDYQNALDYIGLAERVTNAAERVVQYDKLRAGVYARMGRPDLELESYAKSFAIAMDVRTSDKIREVAARNGKKPEDVFAKAREIRNRNAKAVKGFELKTMDGETVALDSLKAKAILVNFFFPT